jgi:taurine transport system permease protein
VTITAELSRQHPATLLAPPRSTLAPPRGRIRHASAFRISLATGAALFLAWEAASRLGVASPLFLPSPAEVARTFLMVATDGYADASLLGHVLASLGRMGIALLIAVAIGIPLGLMMGMNRWAKGIFDVPIELYWPLPPLAYLPLMIIWLGIGETSKVVLLTLAMLAPICLAAQAGIRSASAERVQAALSLGANRRQIVTSVLLPSALPEILTGVRIGIAAGWSTLVAAELIAARSGLGTMIMSAANFLATDVVFVGLFVIALFAFAFSAAMRALERRLVPWKGKL